jgi:hypothetical protein
MQLARHHVFSDKAVKATSLHSTAAAIILPFRL